jgi:DNA-directed RNA polymerase sigma subunit (sigma70/sigma32)
LTDVAKAVKPVKSKPLPAEDLNTYLKAFPRLPLLTPEQEIFNGRILRGDDHSEQEKEEARNRLILHNTRLVVAEAVFFSKKAPPKLSIMDLCSEGLFGLFDATRRYDPERPCKFSTYATWWIRRYIRKAITSARLIRIPYYMNGITNVRWTSPNQQR